MISPAFDQRLIAAVPPLRTRILLRQPHSRTMKKKRQRRRGVEDGSKRRDSGRKEKEGKGNVLVSVRVRPDAGGDKTSGKDWLVDGRQSLVAYRGREGGDYYYGMLCLHRSLPEASTDSTITRSCLNISDR